LVAGLGQRCRPSSIAIHPSGKFAYVTNSGSNEVSVYGINAATGALTFMGTIGTQRSPSCADVEEAGGGLAVLSTAEIYPYGAETPCRLDRCA
jgi:6-phosphogluconolactonase